MKIRWTQNSVRFRISPAELERLLNGQAIQEALALPGINGVCWTATLTSGASSGLFRDVAKLQIVLSPEDLEQLAAPAAEGVYFTDCVTGALPEFKYCVEKDFPCAHPRGAESVEPAGETFDPPETFAQRKNQAAK